MGRAKLNMELISKDKSRNITFKKRKEGMMRKMHEFTTLCDVSACMIIYPPKQDKNMVEPEIWPQNHQEIRKIIEIYKNKSKDSGNKTFGLSDFFHDRKRKIEEELVKLRKKNIDAKYPAELEGMHSLGEAELREFYARLSIKAEYVKSRIEFLKRNNHGFDMNVMDFGPGKLIQRGLELDVINQQQSIPSMKSIDMQVPIHYPSLDYHQEMQTLNQKSMMMLLMSDNDPMQFGGASTSNNIPCASFKRQVIYDSMAGDGRGVMDNLMYHNPVQLSRYYAMNPPLLPQVPPHYMPCPPMPGIAPPQLNYVKEDEEQDDILQYLQFKNQGPRYFD